MMINSLNLELHDFPFEIFVSIEHQSDLLARITLIALQEGTAFYAEMDLIFNESKKIYRHVGSVRAQTSWQEARDLAMQELSFFLTDEKNFYR